MKLKSRDDNYILSITPNPTLDLSGNIETMISNEKIYVKDELRLPGGNAINAARIIKRLGAPVQVTGLLGGSTGVEILHLLKKEGIKSSFVKIKGNSRTCISIKSLSKNDQYRFDFPGPKINFDEKEKLLKKISSNKIALILIGGSLPLNFNEKDIKKILSKASHNKTRCIVDCPASIMKSLLNSPLYMIKPNLSEFQAMMNFESNDLQIILEQAKKIKHIPYICISSVNGGALLIHEKGPYFGKSPKVTINTTIGAGDSMVGAMASEIFNGNNDPQDILRWGLAAATATLKQKGTSLGNRPDILNLYKKTKVIKLI